MVKHAQTIRRQIPDNLSVFDHFVKLALKGLMQNFSCLGIIPYQFRHFFAMP